MPRKPDPKSKAGFARSLPSTLSAADVVAAGKKKGVRLDVNYVYKVIWAHHTEQVAFTRFWLGPHFLNSSPAVALSHEFGHLLNTACNGLTVGTDPEDQCEDTTTIPQYEAQVAQDLNDLGFNEGVRHYHREGGWPPDALTSGVYVTYSDQTDR